MNHINQVIYNFTNYIKYTNNLVDISKYLESNSKSEELRCYIKYALKQLNQHCYKAVILRERRKEIRDDITDLKRQYVSADSLDINEGGFNNGYKENNVELRHIKIFELQEKLTALTNESLELEASLKDNKDLVEEVFDIILNENQATIMKLYYIQCWSASRISVELYYTRDAVNSCIKRAIKNITKYLIINNLVVSNSNSK